MTGAFGEAPAVEFYRDADGWHTDRDYNAFPATANELECALVALQALHILGMRVVHLVATKRLVIADGLDALEELSVAGCLEQLRGAVWPDGYEFAGRDCGKV